MSLYRLAGSDRVEMIGLCFLLSLACASVSGDQRDPWLVMLNGDNPRPLATNRVQQQTQREDQYDPDVLKRQYPEEYADQYQQQKEYQPGPQEYQTGYQPGPQEYQHQDYEYQQQPVRPRPPVARPQPGPPPRQSPRPPPRRRRPGSRPRPGRPQSGGIGGIFTGLQCSVEGAFADLAGIPDIEDPVFVKTQLDCLLQKVQKCDATGELVKRLAPDVIAGRCPPPCTPCTQIKIKEMMSTFSRKHPQLWFQVVNLYTRKGPN